MPMLYHSVSSANFCLDPPPPQISGNRKNWAVSMGTVEMGTVEEMNLTKLIYCKYDYIKIFRPSQTLRKFCQMLSGQVAFIGKTNRRWCRL